MARFKPYDYSQGLMVQVNLDEQIEPVFANIRHAKGLTRINYRGRQKVETIWELWSIMHNIGKIALYRPGFGVQGALRG